MSKHLVKIPESYVYYLNNSDHIDLLEQQAKPLDDFDFDDVIKFWQAKASLELCKRDYFEFMLEIFCKTWLEAMGNDFLPLSQAEVETLDHVCSLDSVWQDSEITWYFKIKKTGLTIMASLTSAKVKEGRGLRLCTAATTSDDEWALGEKMKTIDKKWEDAWEDADKDMNIYSKNPVSIKSGTKNLNVTSLIAGAKQAVEVAKRLAGIK